MSRVRTLTGAALPLLLAGFVGLVAIAPAHAADHTDDDATAIAALRRAAVAALGASFEATLVTTAWTGRGASTHVLDVVQRDGLRWTRPREQTTAGWSVPVRVGSQEPSAERLLDLLTGEYLLARAGQAEVAGRPADVVVAYRGGRERARWWLDRRTGLVLRQEVFDQSGGLLRMAAFLDQRPRAGDDDSGSSGVRAAVNPAGLATGTASSAAGGLADAVLRLRGTGFAVPATLPGGLHLVDAGQPQSEASSAVHLTYTDGLCALSLFQQRGRLDGRALAGFRAEQWGQTSVHVADGWPARVVWQRGGTVLTLISDAEPGEVRRVVEALPGERSHGGLVAALLGGLDAATNWFRR